MEMHDDVSIFERIESQLELENAKNGIAEPTVDAKDIARVIAIYNDLKKFG